MTEEQFLERIASLMKKMCDVVNDSGYGSDAYNAVLDEINDLGTSFNRSRRRRSWGLICFCVFLLYCLAWLAWAIWF